MANLRVDTIAGLGQTFGPNFNGDLEFNSQNFIVLPKGSSNQQGVLRTTEDVIGVGGTYYDNLVLALPLNEATQFKDVSSRGRNPGTYGNVSISSTISKYYGSSAKFDGSGDLITVGITSDLQFTNNIDFTIELWGYKGASATNVNFFTLGDSKQASGLELYVGTTGTITKVYTDNATRIEADSNPSNFAWHHYAVVRESGTLKLYIDGTVQSQTYDASSNQFGSDKTVVLSLGREYYNGTYNGLDLLGHLQDFRIYKGLAKYTANFTPPERIAEIGVGFKSGALRYNTDSNLPELYDGNQWVQLSVSQVGLGTGGDTEPGARGVFGGGSPTLAGNVIDYINISSTGNAIDFGDLIGGQILPSPISSSTRGIFAGGYQSSPLFSDNKINYITIASTGDAQDFGDLTQTTGIAGGVSSSTRGLISGGFVSPGTNTNVIQYLTIASTGNSVDYGDLPIATRGMGCCNSATRGIFAGGYQTPALSFTNTINFVTISTLGNAQDFGDLTGVNGTDGQNVSSATRGVWGGGRTPTATNRIEFITIATLGNAQDFGDLTQARQQNGGCSSPTRGVWGGGQNSPLNFNIIDYINIPTQGDAVDFGDLTVSRLNVAALSNAHGGL